MTFQNVVHFPDPSSDSWGEEFRERLQLQIYSWIQKEIPSWQPEFSPKYMRNSQALAVGLQGRDKTPSGLVYFKSVFDPCWSNEDLARLRGADYAWLIVILSPCERFYEFEARFSEIAVQLPKLVVWRPDAPSRAEFEKLRKLMSESSTGESGKEPPIYKAIPDFHQSLDELYVNRGQIIAGAERRTIAKDIKNQSIGNYILAQLTAIAPKEKESATTVSTERATTGVATERQALHWAELLTGMQDIRKGSIENARAQLIEWMDSIDIFFKKLPEFPEAFMTIRFWRDFTSTKGCAQNLKPIIYSLRTSSLTLRETMDHIARNFGFDEKRLLRWRQSLDNLGGLARWMPSFLYAQDYLRAAFPLGQDNLDRVRDALLQSLEEPYGFLESTRRDEFDAGFFEFKRTYVECYCTLHENSFQLTSENNENSKIEPIALRNLDLLTGLQYTDKIYLNRVNILAKWVQRNKCSLPIRKIMERYPRCYCNFNPFANQQPAGMGVQINNAIQEGIEYFRTILRNCEGLIVKELKSQQVDDSISRQIEMILNRNPMSALKPQSIEVLNRIILKHSSEFLSSIRNYTPKNQ
jgi:hypothetical protein